MRMMILALAGLGLVACGSTEGCHKDEIGYWLCPQGGQAKPAADAPSMLGPGTTMNPGGGTTAPAQPQ